MALNGRVPPYGRLIDSRQNADPAHRAVHEDSLVARVTEMIDYYETDDSLVGTEVQESEDQNTENCLS